MIGIGSFPETGVLGFSAKLSGLKKAQWHLSLMPKGTIAVLDRDIRRYLMAAG
jgi:hypothetical protein